MELVSQRKFIKDSWFVYLTYSMVTLLEVVVYTEKLCGSNKGVQGTTVTVMVICPRTPVRKLGCRLVKLADLCLLL